MTTPGIEFANAFLTKNFDQAGAVFVESAPFMVSTPGRTFEGSGPEGVVNVLSSFLQDDDLVEKIIKVEEDAVGPRKHLVFRFLVNSGGTTYECEQHGYYDTEESGKIVKMRILCSGWLKAA